ncbi:hypothetical protein KEM55_000507 [Ascosphaera atra]|nr:hypothetical protein KEM55_000507 [Ascosphaera atra]
MTYFNTAFFVLPLFPIIGKEIIYLWRSERLKEVTSLSELLDILDSHLQTSGKQVADVESQPQMKQAGPHTPLLARECSSLDLAAPGMNAEKLGLKATAKIAFEFCILWFSANYFAFACLQHTTVSSTTILTSTSGLWTLIFGVIGGVERWNVKKLIGVLISLAGITLISRVDMSGSHEDGNPSTFPLKPTAEMALGDAMAAFSAILYGIYTVVMKRKVGDEGKVNMTLFFGLVGLTNMLLLWPGFVLLHVTGIETFALPDSSKVWNVLIANALVSLISDIAWAYSMLLTTPLIVTVGLSMTIPLSLIGEIFIHGKYSSLTYWLGAALVFFSFAVVNHEG